MRPMHTMIAGIAAALLLLAATPASAADCTKYPCDPSCSGFCGAGCTDSCFVDGDSTVPGNGTPAAWASMPIKYKVNIDALVNGQGLNETEVLAAIKAAFDTWAAIPCTTLEFQYAGKSQSTTQVDDHILIYFKNDPADPSLYYLFMGMKPTNMDEMLFGLMQLNATPNHPTYSFDWTTKGAVANKYDIQTVVTYMLGPMLGFNVGQASGGQVYKVPFALNYQKTDLCQAHKDAATYVYFDSADSSCTKPTMSACGGGTTTGDGGGTTTGDGGGTTTGDGGGTTTGDSGGTTTGDGGGTTTGDGGTTVGDGGNLPPADDDGCCRVSHGPRPNGSSAPYLSLLGLGLLLLLRRRRR